MTGVSFEVAVISRAESSAGVEVGGEATFFDVAGVEQGGASVAVTHPLLDVVEVGAGFKVVGGERRAQHVVAVAGFGTDSGFGELPVKDALDLPDAQPSAGAVAVGLARREQPLRRGHFSPVAVHVNQEHSRQLLIADRSPVVSPPVLGGLDQHGHLLFVDIDLVEA